MVSLPAELTSLVHCLRPLFRAEVFESFCYLLTGLLIGEAKAGTVRASVFAPAAYWPQRLSDLFCRHKLSGQAFMAKLAFVGRYGLPEYVDGATVVSQGEVDRTQVAVHAGLQDSISDSRSQGQGALVTRQRVVIVAHGPERVRHVGADLPKPPLVAQRLGERFGLAEIGEPPSKFSECL